MSWHPPKPAPHPPKPAPPRERWLAKLDEVLGSAVDGVVDSVPDRGADDVPEHAQDRVAIGNAAPPGRVTVGVPTVTFEAAAPDGTRYLPPYRPDTLIDAWSTASFTVRAASVRGDDHRFRGTPRQDDLAIAVHPASGSLVIAVADGVSASPQSHLGATAACRYAVATILQALDAGDEIDWTNLLRGAAWAVVETAQRASGASTPDPEGSGELCGSTLCAVVVAPGPTGTIVTSVAAGDSGAILLSGRTFTPIVSARTTQDGISSSAVTALPHVPRDVTPRLVTFSSGEVLLVATDGILDPLGSGQGPLGRLLAEHLEAPPDPIQFCRLTDFSRETFDDDRTLVAVWHRADRA